jgi:hypothetical protein
MVVSELEEGHRLNRRKEVDSKEIKQVKIRGKEVKQSKKAKNK